MTTKGEIDKKVKELTTTVVDSLRYTFVFVIFTFISLVVKVYNKYNYNDLYTSVLFLAIEFILFSMFFYCIFNLKVRSILFRGAMILMVLPLVSFDYTIYLSIVFFLTAIIYDLIAIFIDSKKLKNKYWRKN